MKKRRENQDAPQPPRPEGTPPLPEAVYAFGVPPSLADLTQKLAARGGVKPGTVAFQAFARGLAQYARDHGLELPPEMRSEDQEMLDLEWTQLAHAVGANDVHGAYIWAERLLTRFLRSDAAPSWAAGRGKNAGERGAYAVLFTIFALCQRAAEPLGLSPFDTPAQSAHAVTIHRVTMHGRPPTELVLYLPLIGDPLGEDGPRFDERTDGPHLCRAITPDGEHLHGELTVDDRRVEAATIAWLGRDEHNTDVSDLFAAALKRGRSVTTRHFRARNDAWDFRIVNIE